MSSDNSSKKTLELKLINGTRIIRSFDLNKIYNLVGHVRRKWFVNKKFPFFHFEYEDYITFRYQDTYMTMRDASSDSKFSAVISIAEFIAAFGVNFTSYEELQLISAVHGR